jgi:hypothetical protein
MQKETTRNLHDCCVFDCGCQKPDGRGRPSGALSFRKSENIINMACSPRARGAQIVAWSSKQDRSTIKQDRSNVDRRDKPRRVSWQS